MSNDAGKLLPAGQTEMSVAQASDVKVAVPADDEAEDGYQWAIKMPPFNPGEGYDVVCRDGSIRNAEKQCGELLQALKDAFGPNNAALHVCEVAEHGQKPVFIKVRCGLQALENYAEHFKLQLECRPSYMKKTGNFYLEFTRARKASGVFVHTNRLHKNIEESADYDCTAANNGEPCKCDLFLGYQKEQIVREQLDAVFDAFMGSDFAGFGLQKALKDGLILDLFPLHEPSVKRNRFSRHFLSTAKWPCTGWLTVWSWTNRSRRMVNQMRAYFGEKIAFYFGFLHLYTSWMLLLAIPGLLLALVQYGVKADNAFVPFYCVFVAIWSVLFLEFWLRKQSVNAYRWNMDEFEEEEKDLLMADIDPSIPEVIGFYDKNVFVPMTEYAEYKQKKEIEDEQEWQQRRAEKARKRQERGQNPVSDDDEVFLSADALIPRTRLAKDASGVKKCKQVFTNTVLLTIVAGVVIATLGLLVFRLIVQRIDAFWGGVSGGVVNAFCIAILDQVYRQVAIRLNDWEHHRTATEYEDNLIVKTFFFQFVNSYCSLFYIAFWKGHGALFGEPDQCTNVHGGETDSCMEELATQLTSIMLTRITIGNFTEVVTPFIQYRIGLYKTTGTFATPRDELNQKDSVLAESKMPKYGSEKISGTFYEYSELAIQFGYVVLFAPAFPLASAIACLSNIIENATDGYKMFFEVQMPIYHGAQDIGPWLSIFRFIGTLAVLTNCLILGFTSDQLDSWLGHPPPATKWLIVIGIEHGILLLQFSAAYVIPNEPAWVTKQKALCAKIQSIEIEHKSALARRVLDRKRGMSRVGSAVSFALSMGPPVDEEKDEKEHHVEEDDVERPPMQLHAD